MEKKINNEELQSRREFFKKAAKSALPVIAAVALASVPTLANAADIQSTGCTTCSGTCVSNCGAHCGIGCGGACRESCHGTCKGTCRGTCSGHSR